MIEAAIFVVITFFYGLISRRLRLSVISSAMVFVTAGLLIGSSGLEVGEVRIETPVLLTLGELALALILFNDAARMRLTALKGDSLPARMLAIGLPLTIGAGTAVATLLFIELTIWEAAIIGTVLAPTDASLGKQVVNSTKVPIRIRQTLNIEAGLNDGIAVPFLLIFLTAAQAERVHGADVWITFASEIGFGLIVGLAIGFLGSRLFEGALNLNWVTETFRNLVFPAMALSAFFIADLLGGSGFIAAFTSGLTTAWIFKKVSSDLTSFIEAEGQVIDLGVFFIFATLAAVILVDIDVVSIVYAVLSLTLIRMIPVSISLIGRGLKRDTVLFLGWFGPRGLASIVLALLALETAPQLAGLERVRLVMTATVLLSIFAHGISTNPLIDLYSSRAEAFASHACEKETAPDLPVRRVA